MRRHTKIVGLLLAGALYGVVALGAESNPLAGEKLFRDVEAYYNFGDHRTATAADLKTSEWLRGRLRAAGLQAEFFHWMLDHFFLDECALIVEGKTFESFPLWQPKTTGARGVRAPLARFTAVLSDEAMKGRIVLFSAEARQGQPRAALLERAARNGAAGAVFVLARGGRVAAQNAAPTFAEKPLPLPVAIVASAAEAALAAAAEKQSVVELRIVGRYEKQAKARNVVARLNRGKKLIVVSTPISGWFGCASERGTGVALWLALAEWAAARKSDTSFLFIGNSGHELGDLGAEKFLASPHAPKPAEVTLWIHLGAGIASREWERAGDGWKPTTGFRPGLLGTREPYIPLLREAFAGVPYTPHASRILGELKEVMEAGYPAFGLIAGTVFGHTRDDRPDSTGPELLEPIAKALVHALERIEASSK
jgi:hypothetical protein